MFTLDSSHKISTNNIQYITEKQMFKFETCNAMYIINDCKIDNAALAWRGY